MSSRMRQASSPPTLMVWSVTDRVIEDAEVRMHEYRDIKESGFGGIMAFVRCSRYSWDDVLAQDALRDIARLCRRDGLHCWLVPDPRLVSHVLVRQSPGLELLLFGNAARADSVPNLAPVSGGSFSVRCAIPPRHVHTLRDVAVEFSPLGLARVYAVRIHDGMIPEGGLRDVSALTRMFYNARDGYVEAFGRLRLPDESEWRVLAFFHVRTNHVDFSNTTQLVRYIRMLTELKTRVGQVDGVAWDEPGFTCVYGALPFTPAIRRMFRRASGKDLTENLWKLALDSIDGSHIPARITYYESVQKAIVRAEDKFAAHSRSIWGAPVLVGIHDTWHFESADMCDMNHGSMDLWQTAHAKGGGFVDLGGVQELADPNSAHYANLAAMSVIAASLGKLKGSGLAFNNLWTVGDDDGDGSQVRAMDHCVKTMALFGTRWLAHAYGPVGTVGQERTFLGSPPLPGYPHHSTWRHFPEWNTFLSSHLPGLENRLPTSNLLFVFPVETLYSAANARADAMARRMFELCLALLDHHYHFDIIGSTLVRKGKWRGESFLLGNLSYDRIVYPFPSVADPQLLKLLRARSARTDFVFCLPASSPQGKRIRPEVPIFVPDSESLLSLLATRSGLRPVRAPANTWTSMIESARGTIVMVSPARAGVSYSGRIDFGGRGVAISESNGLTTVLFPRKGDPVILKRRAGSRQR